MTPPPPKTPSAKAKEEPPKVAPASRRKRDWTLVAETAAPILRPAFEARGFSQARIIADWALAVGPRLEGLCWPVKLIWRGAAEDGEGGTLVVGATGGAALEVQHLAPQIMARINAFYGYNAVARLSIDQTSPRLPRRPAPPPPPPEAPPPCPDGTDPRLAGVADPGLRAALDRLIRNRAARDAQGASPPVSRKDKP